MTQLQMYFEDDLVRRVLNPTKKDFGKCTSIAHEGTVNKIPEPRSYMGSIDGCCVSGCKNHVVMFYIDLMNPKAMFVCYDHSQTWMAETPQPEKVKLVRKYIIMHNKETPTVAFVDWKLLSVETHVQEPIILQYKDKKTGTIFDFDIEWCGKLKKYEKTGMKSYDKTNEEIYEKIKDKMDENAKK